MLIRLREEGRAATREEQAVLVRYVGWGGLPQAFDARNNEWAAAYRELIDVFRQMPEGEYEKARRSTQDAHFTSQTVISGIYQGLERMGFSGGHVLEPAAGIGNFIGLMPQAMRQNSTFHAVELDPVTADILKHLYPDAHCLNKGFHEVPPPLCDAVVMNPPFGNQQIWDRTGSVAGDKLNAHNLSIHNYFALKSIRNLRAGGVMGMVISRYFMDRHNSLARELIAKEAHFLGAIRLPNTAFRRNALTDVTTDVVFFQKAMPGEEPNQDWVETGTVKDRETGEDITINQYFVDHPEQMIGRMAISNKMFRESVDCIASPADGNLADAIAQRLHALPENIYRTRAELGIPGNVIEDSDKPRLDLEHVMVGGFFVTPDDRLAVRKADVFDRHDYEYHKLKNKAEEVRIRGMLKICQAARELQRAEQNEYMTDEDLVPLRARLNEVYDAFVSKQGYLNSQVNKNAIGTDPNAAFLQSLERDYDKGISRETARKHGVEPREQSAKKMPIFTRRVNAPRRVVTHVDNAKEALLVSMNEKGCVDLDYMARLYGNKSEEEILQELQGRIYLNPENKQWEIADLYLTGNVKHKLKMAEQHAQQDPAYAQNVAALQAVQPADIDPVDISIQLGSTWVPDRVVNQFVGHLLGEFRREIAYHPEIGKWVCNIPKWGGDYTANTSTWGTEDYPASRLIEAILTNKPIEVVREVMEGAEKVKRKDVEATVAANQKADEIRQAFLDWVWEDKDRRELLAAIYNERFNTNVPARYDGSHLELPGTSIDITLRPHQKDAIWRGVQDGTALFDHVVGAGKTMVCIGTAMESKRLGLMKKPMIVVPNHLLEQWKSDFYTLYPGANVLVAEKKDFEGKNRERLFGRIANGDWDAVVVAHSSFKMIGMPPHVEEGILKTEEENIINAINLARGSDISVKELEKQHDRIRARLRKLAETGKKDRSTTFVDLGVDALFVDEAHEFKNLAYATTMDRIAGLGNKNGSQRAFDLFIKCRYLQMKNNGRGVFFATGTPISNTIAELYTMQKYLQYDDMERRGILNFDAWASTFGAVVTGWELDATGVNYRLNRRFAKFQNVPELTAMYRTFADVVSRADLDRQAEEQGTRFPVPKLKGGKPENIVVERSTQQANFMGVQVPVLNADGEPLRGRDGIVIKNWNRGSIIYRMENLPNDPREDNPLKITNEARKAGLDYRLIDPNAPDDPDSKVNVMVENIYQIWKEWEEQRGTQLVFCDLSTPKLKKAAPALKPEIAQEEAQEGVQEDLQEDDAQKQEEDDGEVISMDELLAAHGSGEFSVYDDIKAKLIARGVPEEEVRFIHEAKTDLQKQKLFDQMNRGEVRILLGSTMKMGAGMNVQKRLVALHHADAPWRPSDLEQREGRILRQGNLFYKEDPDGFEVRILRYATQQTYDARMWQTIEIKANAIDQFRKGDSLQRVIEDVTSEAANAAEMKAASTGNPLIFMQVQISSELKKMEALLSNHKRQQHRLENRAEWLSKADDRMNASVRQWSQEIELRNSATTEEFRFETPDGKVYGKDERESVLSKVQHAMLEAASSWRLGGRAAVVDVGRWRGFDIQASASHKELQFLLRGASGTTYSPANLHYNADDKFSLSGFTSRLDHFMNSFEKWRDEAKAKGAAEREEYVKVAAAVGQPFPQQARLDMLREDNRIVIAELKKMQDDADYVSTWTPKSLASEHKETPAPKPEEQPQQAKLDTSVISVTNYSAAEDESIKVEVPPTLPEQPQQAHNQPQPAFTP